jgi:hypothetical protein
MSGWKPFFRETHVRRDVRDPFPGTSMGYFAALKKKKSLPALPSRFGKAFLQG